MPEIGAQTEAHTAASRAAALAGGALEAERRSAENLGARAAWLIGFSGVMLALTAALGRDAGALNLGAVGEPVAESLFIVSIGILLAAALVSTSAVSPKPRGRTPSRLLDDLRHGKVAVGDVDAHVAQIDCKLYRELAAQNDDRGRILRWAFRLLIAGLFSVASHAVTIGIVQLAS